jgi:hypothetical protein
VGWEWEGKVERQADGSSTPTDDGDAGAEPDADADADEKEPEPEPEPELEAEAEAEPVSGRPGRYGLKPELERVLWHLQLPTSWLEHGAAERELAARAASAAEAEAAAVSRAVPSSAAAVVTEIYLCHPCSGHEGEDGNAPAGGGRPPAGDLCGGHRGGCFRSAAPQRPPFLACLRGAPHTPPPAAHPSRAVDALEPNAISPRPYPTPVSGVAAGRLGGRL